MTAKNTDTEDADPTDSELCREALVASGQMAYRYDSIGDRLTLCGAVEALTGRNADAIGRRLADLLAILHPDDQALIDAADQQLERASGVPRRSVRCVHPDGTTVCCDVLGELFTDPVAGDTRQSRCGVFVRSPLLQTGIERQHLRHLSHALEISRLGGWSMDIRTQQSTRTQHVDEIFGLGGAPWNYRVFLGYVHPDDRERIDRSFSRTLESGRDLDLEARIIRPDGELRWIHLRGSMNEGPEGDERVVISVIRDITVRKRAEQRDRFLADVSVPLNERVDRRVTLEQVARLAVPFLGDHCSVDLLDSSGTFVRIVSTSSRLASETIGLSGLSVGSHVDVWRQLAAGEVVLLDALEPHRLDVIARTQEENLLLRALGVRSYLGVPMSVSGRVVGILHFYCTAGRARHAAVERDVAMELAPRVAVALENARLYQALQDSDHRKDEFLAMLSHELRNPLESLSIGVELIESETAADGQRDWARHMIRTQIDRLTNILADLLDVSRYTFDKVVLDRCETELAPLVSSTIEGACATLDVSGYELSFDAPGSPIHASVDAVRVSQAIGNLLANALEYGAGRGVIHVALDYERATQGGVAHISVTDEGVGIEAAHLESVFEPFAQIDATIDRTSSGLGMGLTLAKRIADMHDGSIVAASDGPGRGSTFILTLPASNEQREALPSHPTQTASPVDPGGRRLLLVDDNAATVNALRKLFVMKGYEVETAEDGLSAIALARTFRPHMAVLDIGLPGANGYEVARSLRESYAGESLLLIALSGYGQQKDRDRSTAAGFDHHLLKPVNFKTIIDLLLAG